MKRFTFIICLLTLLSFHSFIFADTELDLRNFGSEDINEPAKQTPFNLDSKVDYIGTSKITNSRYFNGDRFRFAQAEVEAGGVVYYVPEFTEGAQIALSYTETYIGWENNPWFDQDHFRTPSVAIGLFTKRIKDWFWRGQFSINFDTKKLSAQYMNYDIVFWGRYTLRENIGIHFGFYVQTGMRMDRIFPVFGVDWLISPKWKLNAVYPLNVSLEYYWNQSWSFAVGGRSFNSRYRVGPHECHAKSLIRYENTGGEFIVKYETATTTANIRAGYTLGGYFRYADKNNHHVKHYDFKPAPYAGAEIEVNF